MTSKSEASRRIEKLGQSLMRRPDLDSVALPLVLKKLDGLDPVHVLAVRSELERQLLTAALAHTVAIAISEAELVEKRFGAFRVVGRLTDLR